MPSALEENDLAEAGVVLVEGDCGLAETGKIW